jgi:hypothetical protein
MAVGNHETGFGTAKFTGGMGPGMHNHGAYQCGSKAAANAGKCDCDGFLSVDSRPPPGGGPNVKYAVCFKKYQTDVDGAADLIKLATRTADGNDPLKMMRDSGNSVLAFALGMYGNRYFESFNPSTKDKEKYAADIKAVQKMAEKMNAKDKNKAIARAISPFDAGRVMVYGQALNRCAAEVSKGLGHKQITKFSITPGYQFNPKSAGGATLGAVAGFLVAGPIGAAVGAGVGFLGGREL